MPTEKRKFGDKGEEIAANFLQKKGYNILEKNFLVRQGEIDIVALSPEKILVFVEVKTRRNTAFGTPIEAISPQKAQKIMAAVERYLQKHTEYQNDIRIDVIGILFPGPQIEHIENAIEDFG